MRWTKLGLVYAPKGDEPWARSHAMLPTCLKISPDLLRVYYAATDEKTVGRIGYLEIDPRRPTEIVSRTDQPVLDIGAPGCFDDNGICPSSLVSRDGKLLLYYVGFQLQTKIPYTMFAGLAESDDGGSSFTRVSSVPVFDRRNGEPYFRTAPHVMADGDRWRAWYIGGGGWLDVGGAKKPSYELRHVRSADGRRWNEDGVLCLAPNRAAGEIGFGRPFVLHENGTYKMVYSIRSEQGYSLGYAVSGDGLNWERRDGEVGIARSHSGWDGEMICYAAIVDTAAGRLMFYNGNQYGKSGFGVAIAE